MAVPTRASGVRADASESHHAAHLAGRRRLGRTPWQALAACVVVLVAFVVAVVVVRSGGGDEPVQAPEPRVAFAQASHRLMSAGVFGYEGSVHAEAASPVRPGLWLAAEVRVEGEVQLPSRTREVMVDSAGRAVETVVVGPTAWGRSAERRDDLSHEDLSVVFEGPPVMGAALVGEWLGATTDRRRDGTDDHGRAVYSARFAIAPTHARPAQPAVEGDLRLTLDSEGDPALVEVDGTVHGSGLRMGLTFSDIGGDIRIPAPGGRALGVTGPVTRDDALAAGITHPVHLGLVPEGWVLMRMVVEGDQPHPGCSTLRLDYQHVDRHQSANNQHFNDDTIALRVRSPSCRSISELPNYFLEVPFVAGSFAGFVSDSNSFDEFNGIVTDGNTIVEFATDLDVDDARVVLESLRPFEPAMHATPVDLAEIDRA